jgi:hypothetical protein
VIPTPWRLIGIGVGVLVLLASLWWVQARIRVSYQAEQERDQAVAQHKAYRESVQAMAARTAQRMELDGIADTETAQRIESLEAESLRLAASLDRIPATVETPNENGTPRVSINPRWWLCLSNHVVRDPATTAACEAGSGDASLPAAVSR